MTTDNSRNQATNHCEIGNPPTVKLHPNGRPMRGLMVRPQRDDRPFEEIIFPPTTVGQLLQGIVRSFLIKQEYRMGWAHKSACDEPELYNHPCEVVAAHQWGVAWLIMTIFPTEEFKKEVPNFDLSSALQMALAHDIPELVVGDITPRDGVSAEQKHELESRAMKSISGSFPEATRKYIEFIYSRYEDRQCPESKFVKDCDRLDFMLEGFVRERQGFGGFPEFYSNSKRAEFSTQIARDMAELLTEVRNSLAEKNLLYKKQ